MALKRLVLLLCISSVLFVLKGCGTSAEPLHAEPLQMVKSGEHIDGLDQQRVKLVGVYRQHGLRKVPNPGGPPPALHGRVYIELEDQTQVFLLPVWDRRGLRPSEEINRFEDKKVVLIGTIHKEAPNRPGPAPAQNIALPCLTDLENIQLHK